MQILGVRIDEVTKKQALEKAQEFLYSDKSHKIFTPNPEMLVDAQKDAGFKTVLNDGDLNLCDGFGLWLATRPSLRGRRFASADETIQSQITRTPGTDFMLDLCDLAEREGKSIYLLGSDSDEVLVTANKKNGLIKICVICQV
ncbi:WecB/TagA/CpsF family glycosyltransferase [Candidatus Peregrinibacteria bacterium]|nr:WecB/TagA/CpsF family glycosyltransferase [Candidatus Peregrinibacteria bacterium]